MLEQERAHMMPMPMPTQFDRYVESSARVSSTVSGRDSIRRLIWSMHSNARNRMVVPDESQQR